MLKELLEKDDKKDGNAPPSDDPPSDDVYYNPNGDVGVVCDALSGVCLSQGESFDGPGGVSTGGAAYGAGGAGGWGGQVDGEGDAISRRV